MSDATHTFGVARLRETGVWSRRTAGLLAALLAVEALLVATYLLVTDAGVVGPRYLVYPFVWIDLSLLAVLVVGRVRDRASAGVSSSRARWLPRVVAVGYLLLLAWAGGLVGPGGGTGTVDLLAAPPGWGPILLYDGSVALAVVPFKLVGYLALAWLLSVVVGAAGRPLVSGTLGLATCVGCTGPLLLGVVTAVAGGSVTAATATSAWSYDLSTLVFVVTVAALSWSSIRAVEG